jgi:hypothetical protein
MPNGSPFEWGKLNYHDDLRTVKTRPTSDNLLQKNSLLSLLCSLLSVEDQTIGFVKKD